MNPLMYTGICFAAAGVLTLIERNRMRSQAAARENDTRTAPIQEIIEDLQHSNMVTSGYSQNEPILMELQDAICAADEGMGVRHPDSIVLDRGLTPFLFAAFIPVRDEDADRRLRLIMHEFLARGARITQRDVTSGATALHLLASHPMHCSVQHRMRGILRVLNEYRNGPGPEAPLPGLAFDALLNSAASTTHRREIAVHPVAMRSHSGKLPEELTFGRRHDLLRMVRLQLPVRLQDCGPTPNANTRAHDDDGDAATNLN